MNVCDNNKDSCVQRKFYLELPSCGLISTKSQCPTKSSCYGIYGIYGVWVCIFCFLFEICSHKNYVMLIYLNFLNRMAVTTKAIIITAVVVAVVAVVTVTVSVVLLTKKSKL